MKVVVSRGRIIVMFSAKQDCTKDTKTFGYMCAVSVMLKRELTSWRNCILEKFDSHICSIYSQAQYPKLPYAKEHIHSDI